MSDDVTLLPCPNPWCDSCVPPFIHRIVSHRDEYAVSCGCGFLGPVLNDAERAITAWNTRTPSPDSGERTREALAWYGEQARLARLIHSEGDAGRHALANDGGKRATAALQESAR